MSENCTAVNLQINGTDCLGNQIQASGNTYYAQQAAIWSVNASGTVAYPFAGIGIAPGQGCWMSGTSGGTQATLNGSITTTATAIAIHHAECLHGLLSLPTWVYIGNSQGGLTSSCTNPLTCGSEAIRVVATTATTGDATLTVSTDMSGTTGSADGRGLAGAMFLNCQPVVPAQAWPSGPIVGEMRVAGTSTKFYSDPARPLCPGGIPGPPGPVMYYAGQVSGSASSTTITGHSTSWTQNVYSGGMFVSSGIFNTDQSHNMQAPVYVRFNGTHGGGTLFAFWALVVSVAADNSTIVVSRALPADIDAGPFNYVLTSSEFFSLDFSINSNAYHALQQPMGCESETAAFAFPSHDITSLDLTVPSPMNFSIKYTLGAQGANGPNFYGTGFAENSFYLRSGYTPARTAGNLIDDYWVKDPEICSGYCGGLPLLQGGGIIGGIADKVLNGSTPLTWLDVTPFALSGAADALRNCNYDDPRDQGYLQAELALVALFDPDTMRQVAWDTGLNNWVTRDQTCRRNAMDGYGLSGAKPEQVNSWAGSSIFNTSPALTLTATSTSATGSGLLSTLCAGQDDGTGTIIMTNGLTSATVASGTLLAGDRVLITDAGASPILAYSFQFSVSGTAVILATPWTGTNGTYHFMSENDSLLGYMTSIGTSNADFPDVSAATGFTNNEQLQKVWGCHFDNSGQITLNRPWDGSNGSAYHLTSYVLAGFEVQPFMDGIKTAAMQWASLYTADSGVVAAYNTMKVQLGTWLATYGVDTGSINLGTYYGRVHGACEPGGVPNSMTLFSEIRSTSSAQTSCGFMGLAPTTGGEFASRVNTAEAGNGLLTYYNDSPGPTRKSFVDTYYGAMYGNPSLTMGGLYNDAHYVNTQNELGNNFLGSFKWSGFFFGVGGLFTNSWPALRGGAPAVNNPSVQYRGPVGLRGGIR